MSAKFALLILTLTVCRASDPKVLTDDGWIQGTTQQWNGSTCSTNSTTVLSFFGIPFAKAPIGNLRFKRPVAYPAWNGILAANESKDVCIHSDEGSEDCLYINIWKPNRAQMEDPFPILVWIPGGAAEITEGVGMNFVAMTGIILATFSYRRGPFGFLYTGDEDGPGNVGLFDQQLALKWINNNIIYFGGDPTRITLIGDGPGGAFVNYHLLAPGSRNYFAKAVMMSGTAVSPWAFQNQDEAKRVANRLFEVTDCIDEGSHVGCLRKKDAKALQEATRSVGFPSVANRPFTFTPTIDGVFLTQKPSEYLRNGNFKMAEIAIGTNENDGMAVVDGYISQNPAVQLNRISDVVDVINDLMPGESRYQKGQVLESYFTYATYNDSVDKQDLSDMISDDFFVCPSFRVANYYSSIGEHVYYYRSDLSSARKTSSTDSSYVLLVPYLDREKFSEVDRQVSIQMAKSMAKFVAGRYGQNPNRTRLWSAEYGTAVKISKKDGFSPITLSGEDSNCGIWDHILR